MPTPLRSRSVRYCPHCETPFVPDGRQGSRLCRCCGLRLGGWSPRPRYGEFRIDGGHPPVAYAPRLLKEVT